MFFASQVAVGPGRRRLVECGLRKASNRGFLGFSIAFVFPLLPLYSVCVCVMLIVCLYYCYVYIMFVSATIIDIVILILVPSFNGH